MRVAIVIVAGIVAAVMMWRFQRDHVRRVRRERGAMFDAVVPLLDEPQLEQQGIDYPSLEGRYRGYDVRLRPLDDHLGYRKLPSLWLVVTVKRNLPVEGVFDFIVRPENLEFYSPSGRLAHSLPVPPGWPQHAWLRSDHPAGMPPVERMAPYIADFEDRRLKELVVSSRGVRFVYQAHQADRRRYRIVRSVMFEDVRVDPALARRLLDRAIQIGDDLEGELHDARMLA